MRTLFAIASLSLAAVLGSDRVVAQEQSSVLFYGFDSPHCVNADKAGLIVWQCDNVNVTILDLKNKLQISCFQSAEGTWKPHAAGVSLLDLVEVVAPGCFKRPINVPFNETAWTFSPRTQLGPANPGPVSVSFSYDQTSQSLFFCMALNQLPDSSEMGCVQANIQDWPK